jgi:small subunit ribosomal protein S8
MAEAFSTLIKIKNSIIAKRHSVKIYMKSDKPTVTLVILRLLYEEGYILSYYYSKIEKSFVIINNYYKNIPTISIIKVFNKVSFPVFLKYTDLMAIHKFGIDLLLISTTKGIMPHYKAMKLKLGGKLICYIR